MEQRIGILYVIDELLELGGAERNLVRMLRHLPDRFQPHLLTFRYNPEVQAFLGLPCPIVVYPLHPLYSLHPFRCAPRLLQWIRRERVRIVHSFFETSDIWAGTVAKAGARVKLISSRRDLGIQRNWRLNLIYRLMGGMFDEVHAVSNQVRDYVIAADCLNPAKVFMVPNSIELDHLPGLLAPPRSHWDLPEDCLVIVTVANIRYVKGIDILVRAAASVCRSHPRALFVVAGRILENDYYAEVERLACELGVRENIRFLGGVENPLNLMARSDIFFLPSRSEGMSNALLEAMASSLPAVATSVGGNCQLVKDAETGYLVGVDDAEGCADRIDRLLRAPHEAEAMGMASRRLVASEYSADAVNRRLVERYDALLQRR